VDIHDLPDRMLFNPTSLPGAVEPPGLWPLILTFDMLPAGWRVIKCGGTPVTSADELFKTVKAEIDAKKEEAKLEFLFEKDAEEEVGRYGFMIRHEHVWEKDLKVAKADNRGLLKEWGIGGKMTANQVGFAFQKLLDDITEMLGEFDEQKQEQTRMLVEKSRRCVEVRKRHEHERAAGRFPDRAEEKHSEDEVKNLCDEVPLYFLREMQTTAKEEAEKKEVDQSAKRKNEEAKVIHPWEMYAEMEKHITKYLEEHNQKSKTDNKPKGKKKNHSSEQQQKQLDGRLSDREFEKILFGAGINWLARRETRQTFDTMLGEDKSGRLPLGDVQAAATRMLEFVQQAQTWGQEQERQSENGGKRIHHDELLTTYAQYLDDLDRKEADAAKN